MIHTYTHNYSVSGTIAMINVGFAQARPNYDSYCETHILKKVCQNGVLLCVAMSFKMLANMLKV